MYYNVMCCDLVRNTICKSIPTLTLCYSNKILAWLCGKYLLNHQVYMHPGIFKHTYLIKTYIRDSVGHSRHNLNRCPAEYNLWSAVAYYATGQSDVAIGEQACSYIIILNLQTQSQNFNRNYIRKICILKKLK